jgi:serine/threonine-protein kinase RIO1
MENLKQQLSNTVQSVIDGEFSALQAYIAMKDLLTHLEVCMSEIKQEAQSLAAQYEKGAVVQNYKVEVVSAAGRWDYTRVPEWNIYQRKLKEVEEQSKAAYQAKEKGLFTVTQDGEVSELPVYTPGKETLKLTLIRK